jgi:hypothetical protein
LYYFDVSFETSALAKVPSRRSMFAGASQA